MSKSAQNRFAGRLGGGLLTREAPRSCGGGRRFGVSETR